MLGNTIIPLKVREGDIEQCGGEEKRETWDDSHSRAINTETAKKIGYCKGDLPIHQINTTDTDREEMELGMYDFWKRREKQLTKATQEQSRNNNREPVVKQRRKESVVFIKTEKEGSNRQHPFNKS